MTERENLLSFIADMEAEAETAKQYGENWRADDWKARWKHTAGELCQTMRTLTRAEAKAKQRPGSIGARKARQKAKATRRKLRDLERIIAEPLKDYKPAEPGYITGPSNYITVHRPTNREARHYKDYMPPDFIID